MLEKILSKKQFKYLAYILGAIIEVLGFSLLFSFERTNSLPVRFATISGILIIFSGYLLAVSARRIK